MRTHHKIAFLLLKYIPILIFLLMWFGTSFALLMGIQLVFIDIIAGCAVFPSILIFALSRVFNLCWVHKSLTIYSMCTDLMINLDKYIGLGSMLIPTQIGMLIIGIIVLFFLLKKTKLFMFITHESS